MLGIVIVSGAYAAALAVVWLFLDNFLYSTTLKLVFMVAGVVLVAAGVLYLAFAGRYTSVEHRLNSLEKQVENLEKRLQELSQGKEGDHFVQ